MKTILFINKRLSFSLLFVVSIFTIQAQQGVIRGKITGSKEVLIGSNIRVKGTNVGTTVGESGTYELKLTPGTYTLEASYAGYNSEQKNIQLENNQAQTVDFDLSEAQLN